MKKILLMVLIFDVALFSFGFAGEKSKEYKGESVNEVMVAKERLRKEGIKNY